MRKSYLILIACMMNATSLFSQSIQIKWGASSDMDIDKYLVYRSTHLDSAFDLIAEVYHPDTTMVDVDVPWQPIYYYTVTSVDTAGNESSFSAIVAVDLGGVTPVELISFSSSLEFNDVALEWVTASESNNLGFEIQKSADGVVFNKIGFVEGNGTTSNMSHYRFLDDDLVPGTYYYRLKQIDFNGNYEFSGVVQINTEIASAFQLYQNYPNPFNPATTISYSLSQAAHVNLEVFNVTGQEIYKLVDSEQNAGSYVITWNGRNNAGRNVASGLYYYRLETEGFSQFRQMLLVK